MTLPENGGEDALVPATPATMPVANGRLQDGRGVARGWGRLVMLGFWVMGAVTTAVALFQLFRDVADPVGPRLVTLLAGLVYIGAAVGLTHNGRRMRKIAWGCVTVAVTGPVIMGLTGLGVEPVSELWSPWYLFGRDTWFVSLALPLVGFFWLWWSNPRRIVEIAQELERVSKRDGRR